MAFLMRFENNLLMIRGRVMPGGLYDENICP